MNDSVIVQVCKIISVFPVCAIVWLLTLATHFPVCKGKVICSGCESFNLFDLLHVLQERGQTSPTEASAGKRRCCSITIARGPNSLMEVIFVDFRPIVGIICRHGSLGYGSAKS